MAVVSISVPEIELYNWKVKQEQKKIRTEADKSTDSEPSFSLGYHYSANPEFFAEIALFLTLFFSLSLTKRIGFSFLLAFLFYLQFYIFLKLFLMTVEFPMSYFTNTPAYSILFVVCVIILSFWESLVISGFCHRVISGLKITKP